MNTLLLSYSGPTGTVPTLHVYGLCLIKQYLNDCSMMRKQYDENTV